MLTKTQEYQRAWPILLASILGSGTGVAVITGYSMGALVAPLVETFGWSRAEVTAAPLCSSIGYFAAGFGVGALADRYGARTIALISQALLVPAFAALSFLQPQIWTLYLGYFLLALLGAGTLPMIWSRVVIGWFVASRGLALGLSLMGTGIVGALVPSYVRWAAHAYGWQGAYLALAALPLVLSIPTTVLLFRENPDNAPKIKAKRQKTHDAEGHHFPEALKTLCFWQMSLAFLLVAGVCVAVLVHALSLLNDRGVDRTKAAALVGSFGIAFTVGRLISGSLLDIFRGTRVAVAMYVTGALACGLLLISGNNLVLCGVAFVVVGLAGGAEHDVAAYFTAKYFGRRNYGAIYGLLYTLVNLGGGLGPFAAGAVFDTTHSYDLALYGGIAIMLLAALLIGTLRAPPGLRRHHVIDAKATAATSSAVA